MVGRGLLQKHFSRTIVEIFAVTRNICSFKTRDGNFHFFHYKSMETYSIGTKTQFVKSLMSLTIMQSISFIPLWFLRSRFLNIFLKHLPFVSPRKPIEFSELDQIHIKCRKLLNNHLCKKNKNMTEKNANFHLTHYKSL